MLNVRFSIFIFTCSFFLFSSCSFLNSSTEKIKTLLTKTKNIFVNGEKEEVKNPELVEKYYDKFGYEDKFSDSTLLKRNYRKLLQDMILFADSLGLNREDYHYDYICKLDSLIKRPDYSLGKFQEENEIVFSDAALSFLYHTAYGKEIAVEHNGIDYNIDSTLILNMYKKLLDEGEWKSVLNAIEPRFKEYKLVKEKLNNLNKILQLHPQLENTEAKGKDSVFYFKLQALSVAPLNLEFDSLKNYNWEAFIKRYKKIDNIDTSLEINAKTLVGINQSLLERKERLKETLNYWRWTGRLKEQEFILVNIPSTRLQIVNRDTIKNLEMRVIVGKQETKTPQFTAYISAVISYPYWTPPRGIAVKEILPKVKRNRAYLTQNNFEVIDKNGNSVDPSKIKWSSMNASNFPYKFRQGTGCDNALGIMKFDLNSPFSIYLHDTNRRDLFSRASRFMSHGCVRVEKPVELASYLLQTNADSSVFARFNQALDSMEHKTFKLQKKVPVLIFYMIADINENGDLAFYRDVYGKLES